jgi:hypothetical protein
MGGNVSGTLTSSNAPPEPSFTGIRTTEVEVTHDDWNKNGLASPTTPALTYNRSAKGNRDPNLYSITISAQEATSSFPQSARFATNPMPKRASSMDKVKWAYTKVSMLFAVSIHHLGSCEREPCLRTSISRRPFIHLKYRFRIGASPPRLLEHGHILHHFSNNMQRRLVTSPDPDQEGSR